jgi:hypothetical protein
MGELAGFAYRKAITVNHTDDGAQTNYQMKLTVNHGDGADATGLVYLNHHALNWPTDIQITASDGTTVVDFWREESDATDGTWWIECPSIAAGSTWTGYIYYGDADATDASNMANTFVKTHGSATASFWDAAAALGTQFRFRARVKPLAVIYNFYFGAFSAAGGGADYILVQAFLTDGANFNTSHLSSYTSVNHAGLFAQNVYAITEARYSTTVVHAYVDDHEIGTGTTTNLTHGVNLALGFTNTSVNHGLQDWSFIANYTLNEPTWAASGSEEALGTTLIRSVPRIARILVMSH